mmetsp:Transcript_468/g.710  ORF Transcript_468/g.710 Transcript_468/m.710 type:complete len:709 (+) Transcript_468:3585-5711(+)
MDAVSVTGDIRHSPGAARQLLILERSNTVVGLVVLELLPGVGVGSLRGLISSLQRQDLHAHAEEVRGHAPDGDTARLHRAVANDATLGLFIGALRHKQVLKVRQEPGIGTLASHAACLIEEDSSEGGAVFDDLFNGGGIEEQVSNSHGTATRVGVVVVPAVRASRDGSSLVPVVVVELDARHVEVLSTGGADTERRRLVEGLLSVLRFANGETADDLSMAVLLVVVRARHLHADLEVIGQLEVMPLDSAGTLNNRTIALILVGDQVVVLGGDGRVVVGVSGVIVDGAALLLTRDVVVEDTQTVATVRVGNIVFELAKFLVLGAHVGVEGWANGRLLQIVPVRVAIGAASVVVADDVVGVGDPNGGRGLIGVEQRPGAAHVKDQVTLNQVLALDSIFDEDGVAHGVIGDVVLDTQVVDTVDGSRAVERVVDGVVAHVGLVHGTNHVEVNRVGAQDESLADHGQLNAINTANSGLIARRVADDNSTVLVVRGVLGVTLELDVTGEKTDLSAHLNRFRAEGLDASVMLGEEGTIELDDRVAINVSDLFDGALLGVTTRVGGGSDDDFLTDSPVEAFPVLHVVKSNLSGTFISSHLQVSPSDRSADSVHIEGTEVDTDDLVAEDGDLRVVLRGPKSNDHFRCVAVLLSADLHTAVLDEDVVRIEFPHVSGVGVRREDQGALNIQEAELGARGDIEEQVHALGHLNSFTRLRG